MIAHLVLLMIRKALGGSDTEYRRGVPVAKDQLTSTYQIGTHPITGETPGQITARLDKNQRDFTLQRKVVTSPPPAPTRSTDRNIVSGPPTKKGKLTL